MSTRESGHATRNGAAAISGYWGRAAVCHTESFLGAGELELGIVPDRSYQLHLATRGLSEPIGNEKNGSVALRRH